MLAFIRAYGQFGQPVFIFPRNFFFPAMYEEGSIGCIGFAHESGWMTGANFLKSIQHYQSFTKCSASDPVLLLMDNHCSHLDYQAVKFAKENGIVLLTFPPHCSHALQPLDVAVFGPYKKAVSKNQTTWIHSNPGKRISIKEVAQLFKDPFLSTFTPSNTISGFVKTGICPFNRNIIEDARYAPSFVTDRPGNINISFIIVAIRGETNHINFLQLLYPSMMLLRRMIQHRPFLRVP